MTEELKTEPTLIRNEKGQFVPGTIPNPAGRPVGCKGKFTTLKQAFVDVFEEMQSDEESNLYSYAIKHPKDFYTLVSKLFPNEVHVSTPNGPINIDMKQILMEKLNAANNKTSTDDSSPKA